MKGKSQFTFKASQNEYIVRLKKGFRWWYLLPLLLLLLLLKCNKTVTYKVIDAETKVALENSEISLTSFVFDEKKKQQTNEDGIAKFSVGKYPLYKLIFSKPLDTNATTLASHNGYASVEFTDLLKNLTKQLNIIELQKIKPIRIVVIDSITRQPIQGVKITATNAYGSASKVSDENGKVIIDNLPVADKEEIAITVESTDYEDVRKYYIPYLPQTIDDTIPLLSVNDGGLRGLRGDITVNLAWETTDDLDLIIVDPCGNQVYYKNREETCDNGYGYLDLDANANDDELIENPQENIYWNSPSTGEYLVYVSFYKKRRHKKVPYQITIIVKDNRYTIDSVIKRQKDIQLIDTIFIAPETTVIQ